MELHHEARDPITTSLHLKKYIHIYGLYVTIIMYHCSDYHATLQCLTECFQHHHALQSNRELPENCGISHAPSANQFCSQIKQSTGVFGNKVLYYCIYWMFYRAACHSAERSIIIYHQFSKVRLNPCMVKVTGLVLLAYLACGLHSVIDLGCHDNKLLWFAGMVIAVS